jgi:hypothetical protein
MLFIQCTNAQDSHSANQRSKHRRQTNPNRLQYTIKINTMNPGSARIFGKHWVRSYRCDKRKVNIPFQHQAISEANNEKIQQGGSHLLESQVSQKQDAFLQWMCSRSESDSLWLNEFYRASLLKYIGRIYLKCADMYQYSIQLKRDMNNLDELDSLKRLLDSIKQRHSIRSIREKSSSTHINTFLDAANSLNRWENTSRIKRRLLEMKIIFEFNCNRISYKHAFKITPMDLQQIVDRKAIKSYFDLGCGDGVLTAEIGKYLDLRRENIFGSDVYQKGSNEITFIKSNENQSAIELRKYASIS